MSREQQIADYLKQMNSDFDNFLSEMDKQCSQMSREEFWSWYLKVNKGKLIVYPLGIDTHIEGLTKDDHNMILLESQNRFNAMGLYFQNLYFL